MGRNSSERTYGREFVREDPLERWWFSGRDPRDRSFPCGAFAKETWLERMAVLSLVESVRQALQEEMRNDDRVIVLGEDVGVHGGVFRATDGLQKQFGENRVIDTPLAELGIAGVAIGAAMNGLRPVAEIQFADYIHPAYDQSVEALFFHVPGLKIVVPSTPYDCKGLLKSSIRDDDPVLFFEHTKSYRRLR